MKYPEYLSCAEKHLKGCKSLFKAYNSQQNTNMCVYLELYYMTGYIIEGITVYSAYKLHQWDPSKDIQFDYDLEFSQRTGLDFYYKRSKKDYTGKEIYPSFFQDRPKNALSVQGHKFQPIVLNLLKPNPSFNGIPYFGDGEIDINVERLFNNWKTDIRYYYINQTNPLPTLNQDIITLLLETCQKIYDKHI